MRKILAATLTGGLLAGWFAVTAPPALADDAPGVVCYKPGTTTPCEQPPTCYIPGTYTPCPTAVVLEVCDAPGRPDCPAPGVATNSSAHQRHHRWLKHLHAHRSHLR